MSSAHLLIQPRLESANGIEDMESESTESYAMAFTINTPRKAKEELDVEDLEAKYTRLNRCFYLLATLCVLIMAVYIVVGILILFSSWPGDTTDDGGSRMGLHDSGPHSGQTSSRYPYCVEEVDLSIRHGDLYRNLSYERKNRELCFATLKWLPKMISRVNASIQDRASMIEGKHRKMDSELGRISGDVNSTHVQITGGDPSPASSRAAPVVAHLFLDEKKDHQVVLKWKRHGLEGSLCRGFRCNGRTGEIVIRHSGSYFVYSHVTFRKPLGNRQPYHHLLKNYRDASKGGQETLLETEHGPASWLQGVFRLMENDTLAVSALVEELNTDFGKFTYFGAYLMRT